MNGIVQQGLVLMVTGMTIVFLFLYLLVLAMRLIARFVPRFNHLLPDDAPRASSRPPSGTAAAGRDESVALAVAIAAAYHRGRGGS